MPAISIKNLTKIYHLYDSPSARMKEALHPLRRKYHHDFHALRDVSFEIAQGEVLGIIGKNGSGKSTLLKILTGVLSPTSGSFTVNGKVSALLELGGGFNPELTGFENIYFNSAIMGYTREDVDKKLDEILAFADIGEFIYQPVKTYSSGMFVRLAFAVAINVEPDILIVDEALAVGDEAFQRKCYAKIHTIQKQGATILFVTHSMGNVLELCRRAILLDAGELILKGTSKLVVNQYHKLSYSSNEEQRHKIRKDIQILNQNEALKENFDLNSEEDQEAPSPEKSEHQTEVFQRAFYVPTLQSKSKIEYGDGQVEIDDVKIATLNHEPVNMLAMDEQYIYSYKIKFSVDAERVNFGMMIKSMTGIEIGGALYPKTNHYVPKVQKGEQYLLEWCFTCNLLPGTYCTNVGVMAEIQGQRVFLGRIVDALLFKVQNIPDRMYNVGFVHFNQKLAIREI